MSERSPATRVAHARGAGDPASGAVVPPLQPATTFRRDAQYELIGDFVYGRYAHPTARLVEEAVADLDGGSQALAFSSGMSAFVALLETVPRRSHIVAQTVMYHGALEWLRRLARRGDVEMSLFDPSVPDALKEAVRPGETALVWVETPANPTWTVVDITAASEVAHEAGAFLCVDSTAAPPVTTRPLSLGADLVFHSATKYLNGHSDVSAGVLVGGHHDQRWEELENVRRMAGTVLAPFASWLLLRGMGTLDVRYARASENALRIATHFAEHPAIDTVLYPGLPTHPGHATARLQMTGGFGGMLSLLVAGDAAHARRVAAATQLITPATSLGGIESLIEHRASVEGPESEVPPNLLRLSVGLEDAVDLIADLEEALATSP